MPEKYNKRLFQEYENYYLDSLLSPDYVFPDESQNLLKIYHVPESVVNQDLLNQLTDIGLKWFKLNLFVTPPNHTLKNHIDGPEFIRFNDIEYNQHCGLNWDISNKEGGGLMTWFKATDNGILKTFPIEPPWYYYGISEQCEPIASHVLKGPCLIHTGVIHSMQNLTNKKRYCFSIRFSRDLSFNDVKLKLDKIWSPV
jgi:hypothetical protein